MTTSAVWPEQAAKLSTPLTELAQTQEPTAQVLSVGLCEKFPPWTPLAPTLATFSEGPYQAIGLQ